jgi:hypothetical protein
MSLGQYLGNDFDARNIETKSFGPLQPGKYLAMISKSEVKPTKTGGAGLNLEFTTLQPVENRKVFDWINIAHPTSQKAVDIGKETLAKLGKSVGIFQPKDENEFLNKQVVITVAIDKDDTTRNVIKDYESATVPSTQAVAPPVMAPQAPVASAPQKGASPWS